MNKEITDEKLNKYFKITGTALEMVKDKFDQERLSQAQDFYNMAKSYFEDAHYFKSKNDYVLAYGALNYSHGWLDAGARIRLFKVNDSKLFTVDD